MRFQLIQLDKLYLIDTYRIPQETDWIINDWGKVHQVNSLNTILFERFKKFRWILNPNIKIILSEHINLSKDETIDCYPLLDSWCDLHQSTNTHFCSACQKPSGKCHSDISIDLLSNSVNVSLKNNFSS